MIPSSHSRSGGSLRRTRTVDYQYGYETGEQQQLQQSADNVSSHSRTRGILRNHSGTYRSDDSFSTSSPPRSRDSSVDSLPQSSDWGLSSFSENYQRVPLTGGAEGSTSGRSGRMPRRASLSQSERSESSIRIKSKAATKGGKGKKHNPFNNPFILPDIPKKTTANSKPGRRKMSRRASLSDVPSNDEESVSEHQRGTGKFQRRSSMDFNNNSTSSLGNSFSSFGNGSFNLGNSFSSFRSKSSRKMGRRASMSDAPSSNNNNTDYDTPNPDPTYANVNQISPPTSQQPLQPLPPQQSQTTPIQQQPILQQQQSHSAHSRMGRRNSLTHVSATPARPKSILRRSSLSDVTDASSDDGSSLYDMPPPQPKMSRRSSLSDVPRSVPLNDPPKPLKSSMKMSRRGSLNDVVSTTAAAPIPTTPLSTTPSADAPMPRRSSMKMARRSSLTDVAETPASTTMNDASNELPQLPPRSILRRGSLSDVATEPSTSELPYRVVPAKMGRRGSLNNETPMTPLNDSSSMMSFRLGSSRRSSLNSDGPSSRRSSLSDNPKSAMMDTLTPLYSEAPKSASFRSARMTSLNDVAGPPLSDGLMGMGGGYCVPLKSMSERNERTTSIRGKEVDNSPLSMSERSSISNNRRSFRSTRTASSYYSDRASTGTSSLSGSISSIPMDVFDTYHDSMISHLGGRGGSTRTGRSCYLSDHGSDDSCSSFGTEDDMSVDRQMDEMESSTRTGGIIAFDDSWSINNLAADLSVNDSHAATILFPKRSTHSRTSIQMASMDVSQSTRGRDSSHKLMCMEGDNWDDEGSLDEFGEDVVEVPSSGRRGSLQLHEIAPKAQRRISSLAFDESSLGFGQSTKSITWEDESLGASYGASLGTSQRTRKEKRRSSLTWEGDLPGNSSKKSLTWEDDSPSPPGLNRRSSLELDDGSDDDFDYSLGRPTALLKESKQDSDRSLGDFAEAALKDSPFSSSKQDSDGSLGDFAEAALKDSPFSPSKSDSDGSLGDFVASAAKQDSDGSLGDFADALDAPLRSSLRPSFGRSKEDSDGSLGDFASSVPPATPPRSFRKSALKTSFSNLKEGSESSLGSFTSPRTPLKSSLKNSIPVVNEDSDNSLGDFASSVPSRSSFSRLKRGSDRSLGSFAGSGTDSDEISEDSDGLIRDDELFQDALQQHVASTTPIAFQQARSPMGRRRSIGDYTLSLSGKGEEIPDIDRSEKSITLGRRRSISSIPASALDASTRSRITTISEDSFEITAEELGIYNHADKKNLKLAMAEVRGGNGDDDASFLSCSSDEYASSDEFYDSDEEKEKRVKEGLMWGLGTMGIGAIVGWLAKVFRRGGEEDEQSIFDLETIHDELGQSVAQSCLDESVNFTGSENLWGWASIGDGGASGELVLSALHLPGTETAIISAATGTGGGGGAGAGAAAAAVAATTNTMAVTAAGNVGAIAVTTTAVIGNSAIATGAGVGISGAVSAAGAAGSGVMAALGLTGTGGSTAAVMGSTIGALAVAGTTYYSAATHNMTIGGLFDYGQPVQCVLHPNPDTQTGVFRISLDVSGMEGMEEPWGWMPFSDGLGVNNTSGEVLKELWEELFAGAYNNITNYGCSELFERRVLDANLTATTHTGISDDSSAFLETEWTVTVSCWESCPSEPIFGTELQQELQRKLEPSTESPSSALDVNSTEFLDMNNTALSGANFTKDLINELYFQSVLEYQLHEAAVLAGWERPGENNDQEGEEDDGKVEVGNGVFIVITNPAEESEPAEESADVSAKPSSNVFSRIPSTSTTPSTPSAVSPTLDSPTADPTELPTESPTESPTYAPTISTDAPYNPRTPSPTVSSNIFQT